MFSHDETAAVERGYITAALWTEEMEVIALADAVVSEEASADIAADVQEFLGANEADCREYLAHRDAEHLGHDLWLTRNRHGAGFWDRGLGNLGDRLTEAAHALGEAWLTIEAGEVFHDSSS